MRTPQIINYKNHAVVYLDFSNLRSTDEINDLIGKAIAEIRRRPLKSALTLTNIDGMYFNNTIFSVFSKYVRENSPYVKASAVVGMTGLISIMYNGFVKVTGREVKAFRSETDALEYLANYSYIKQYQEVG
jgi:hypothetical protein